MKKWLAYVLALCLTVCLIPAASAAGISAEESAQQLYDLGLFKGTGANSDGTPIFDLDKTPTRNQALIMLVRLLGKEQEALKGSYDIPFTDVTDTMRPYVGYAYANGLTNGTTATTYSGTNPIKPNQYITFVLRALGYESGKDFQVATAWELSDKLGITNGEFNSTTVFSRGSVAQISYQALQAEPVGTGRTLLEKLKAEGAVLTDQQQKNHAAADIPFRAINDAYIDVMAPALKDFTLFGVDYAVVESDVYFRMRFKSASVVSFLVVPLTRFSDDIGIMEKYQADPQSGEFICKLPLSTFEKYSTLDISPTEDGHQGPDIFITVGMFMTKNGTSPRYQDADYEDHSEQVADFQFIDMEVAKTAGGRVYRMTFQNDEARIIQFWVRNSGQTSGWDISLARVYHPKAGDSVIEYFVSDQTYKTHDEIYVRVRDADSITPPGGASMQAHCWIAVYL